jgi:cell wall-associated NlpC family hydrolase
MNGILLLLILYLATFIPLSSFAQEPVADIAIVSAPLANVHEEPRTKSRLVTQVLIGDEVRLLEKNEYRYRIAIPSQGNCEGWVQQEALQIPKDKGRSFLNRNRPWIVITAPKTEALLLDKTGNQKVPLYAGTQLPILQQNGTEFRIQLPDRSSAIIKAVDAAIAASYDPILAPLKPDAIAKTARKFQGSHVLSGGMTSQGLDMNGLVHVVYRIHGISTGLDRDSLRSAQRVAKKELEPGDILVFNSEGRGLYLGEGRFLHAPNKGTVQVAGIYDKRYAHSLQYGLRLLASGLDEHKRLAEMTADEILLTQTRAAQQPLGKRIAYWAGRFINTPYDPDPLGLYVRTNRIVADESVDCMYHTFRSVELAKTATPGEAVDAALSLRFITQGKQSDGLVVNYDERFQYGEDMVMSGKWGKNITPELGETERIAGTRGKETVDILPKNALFSRSLQKKLQDGDIVYWVKDPNKRAVDEIVAHLSIVHIKSGKAYLIHASGDKDRPGRQGGGKVKEVLMSDYVRNMRFVGAFVTRLE